MKRMKPPDNKDIMERGRTFDNYFFRMLDIMEGSNPKEAYEETIKYLQLRYKYMHSEDTFLFEKGPYEDSTASEK